jgi:uncharacterized membrane protein YqjE
MDTAPPNAADLAGACRRLARHAIAIGENRLDLLLVEVQEERDRFLGSILLALGVAVFSLLAGVALTFVMVLALWDHAPLVTAGALTALYAGTGAWLYARLRQRLRNWEPLPATLAQIHQDRTWLEGCLR